MQLLIKIEEPQAKEFYENFVKEESAKCDQNYLLEDSGIDLFILADTVIPANTTILVDLGISCEAFHGGLYKIPSGFLIYPRSSIYKTPLMMHNSIGVIDASYRGRLKSPLRNMSNTDYEIKRGQRLLQIVIPDMRRPEVKLVDSLSSTQRGSGGFGSTGT